MTSNERVREQRARRALAKLGLKLKKSRVRQINLDNLGGYMVIDLQGGWIVEGSRFELSLDHVEEIVAEQR